MAWDSFFGAMGSGQNQAEQQAFAQQAAQSYNQSFDNMRYGGSGMNHQIDWGATADMNRAAGYSGLFNIKLKSAIEVFVDSLATINPKFIKEIVIPEERYVDLLKFFVLKGGEVEKCLNYNNAYGTILIKNEAYQFDLDKYLEYGPVEEVINE